MIYITYFLVLLVLFVDLILYIPIKIHIYFDNDRLYLYVFSLPILRIDEKVIINNLKGKIDINLLINSKKEDLKIIESIEIRKIHIKIKREYFDEFSYIFYPLSALNQFIKKTKINISSENMIYIILNINIVNILNKIFQIRGLKNERTSNK